MMVRLQWTTLLLLTFITCVVSDADFERLVHDLFETQGYNNLIRPVDNINDTVTVSLGLAMIQLIGIDEKNQVMKSNVWLRMMWTDQQLRWDPLDYGEVTAIRVPANKVWKPDIVLFNNADGKYEVSFEPNVVVNNDGQILWIPISIYKSACTIDVEYFPFDEQRCEMRFGSWTFSGDQVQLDYYYGQRYADLHDYVNNGAWDIIDCPANLSFFKADEEEKGGGRAQNVSQLTFTFVLRRKTLFYTVNLIVPCVLIAFLSVSIFYLPSDAGEKMTMCISVLLALVVFLLLVSKILPPTSDTVPLISKYLIFTFIMNIFTILFTVIIINWNFRSPRTHRMSRLVHLVFLVYMPRMLLMSRPVQPHYDSRMDGSSVAGNVSALRRDDNTFSTCMSTTSISTDTMHVTSETGVSCLLCNDKQQRQGRSRSSSKRLQAPGDPSWIIMRSRSAESTTGAVVGNNRDHRSERQSRDDDDAYHMVASTSCPQIKRDQFRMSHRRQSYKRVPSSDDVSIDAIGGANNTSDTYGQTTSTTSARSSLFESPETAQAIRAIRYIAAHLKHEDDYSEILNDWRYAAAVIDRLQLVIFLTVTVIGTCSILISAPHIFSYIDQDAIKRALIHANTPEE